MTNQKTSEDLVHENIEIFAAYTKGMLESNLEQNRQLLLISALVIGLLVGVFGIDKLSGFISLVVWSFAVVCFLVCTITTSLFFSKNTEHLHHVIEKSSKAKSLKKSLNKTSDIASISFICGMVLLVVLAVCESKFVAKKEVAPTQIIQIYPFNPQFQFHHRHEQQEQCADKKHEEEQQQAVQASEVKHQDRKHR